MMTLEDRFWNKVAVGEPLECWPWTASTTSKGYGQFRYSSDKSVVASRFALEWKLCRDIRPGFYALHTCDNPLCVNPEHLYEGTLSQNTQDSLSRGRHRNGLGQSFNKGSKNGNAKLCEDDVREIRNSQLPAEELASLFCVSVDSIRLILAGKTWKHVQCA